MTMIGSALLVAVALGNVPARAAVASTRACLRCHSMATMAYRDERTGRVVSLAVNPGRFGVSNHRKLACTRCHSREFKWFPHPDEIAGERLRCLDCHRDTPALRKRGFPGIGREVADSVHVRKMGRAFDCFACHDPHTFRLAGDEAASLVAASNAVCLTCHGARERFASLTRRDFPELAATHAWLPNPVLHFGKVRCLDCHLGARPAKESREHLVVPAKEAVRDCAGCHSRNSLLFARLYRHTAKESRARLGFVNAALLNDAYVIGATRNLAADRIALAALALALAGIAVHSMLRWRGRRNRR